MTVDRGSEVRRLLDAALGIPLLLLIGCLRRKKNIPKSIRRIVLLQTAAIGDTLLLAAAIRSLRSGFPEAEVALVLGPSNFSVAQLLPPVERVVVTDVLHPIQALRDIRRLEADILVDYGPWPRINALLSALSGARCTIGFKTKGQHRHFAYDKTADHSPSQHELLNHRALLSCLVDIDVWNAQLDVPEPPDGRKAKHLADRYVVFHPWASGSGKEFKEWPAERWSELALMASEQGLAVFISGGPQDAAPSAALVETIAAAGGGTLVRSLAGELRLQDLAEVIADSVGVISVNTGIMHLAAMLGAPTVGISGPTNPARWGPVGPRAVSVHPDCPDCGYLNLGFEFPRNPPDCMGRIGVADVWAAFRKVAGS
jgi:heptosyltransferase-3